MLLIEAGCKKKEWEFKDEVAYKYHWVSEGNLLEKGVCVSDDYQKYFAPEKDLKVYTTIEYQKIRDVDAKKETISIDLTLTIRWVDPNIKVSKSRLLEQGILLSPTAIEMIWIPDITIRNLTSYKIREEWISLISSQIFTTDPKNDTKGESTNTTVEMKYGIKATVYCNFDHAKYPMDEQKCNVGIGSKDSSSIFALNRNNDKYHNSEKYEAANFEMLIEFFDMNHKDGSNTIGLMITMNRIKTSYIFTYYVPCIAIVLVSGISFVIPVTAIPGRVGLLVTLFLTLINLFIYEMVSDLN